eukprot:189323_1
MIIFRYRSIDDEKIPHDVTHVIIHSSVTAIRKRAFQSCSRLISVCMEDKTSCEDDSSILTRIENNAFAQCYNLKYVQLSKTSLDFVGWCAFSCCYQLESLFLPSTVKIIEFGAFRRCTSLRLLILPNQIDPNGIKKGIIKITAIERIAKAASGDGTPIEYEEEDGDVTDESNSRVNNWLVHHLDDWPLHRLCCSNDYGTSTDAGGATNATPGLSQSHSTTLKKIQSYLKTNMNHKESIVQSDDFYGMTPMHFLAINPLSPLDAIGLLFAMNRDAAFSLDHQEKTPLDYARDYNFPALLKLVEALCMQRPAS